MCIDFFLSAATAAFRTAAKISLALRMATPMFWILVCGMLVFDSAEANAQMTFSTVDRGVETTATNFCMNNSDSDTANVIGVFSEVAQSIAVDMPPTCQGNGNADASQNTIISSSSISGVGSATSSGAFGGAGDARSSLNASFTISQTLDYTVQATVDGKLEQFFPLLPPSPNSGIVQLSNTSGTLFTAQSTSVTGNTFSFSGTLPPGSYTLSAAASSNATSDSQADSSFDFTFTVPEPSSTTTMLGCFLLSLLLHRRSHFASRLEQA